MCRVSVCEQFCVWFFFFSENFFFVGFFFEAYEKGVFFFWMNSLSWTCVIMLEEKLNCRFFRFDDFVRKAKENFFDMRCWSEASVSRNRISGTWIHFIQKMCININDNACTHTHIQSMILSGDLNTVACHLKSCIRVHFHTHAQHKSNTSQTIHQKHFTIFRSFFFLFVCLILFCIFCANNFQ